MCFKLYVAALSRSLHICFDSKQGCLLLGWRRIVTSPADKLTVPYCVFFTVFWTMACQNPADAWGPLLSLLALLICLHVIDVVSFPVNSDPAAPRLTSHSIFQSRRWCLSCVALKLISMFNSTVFVQKLWCKRCSVTMFKGTICNILTCDEEAGEKSRSVVSIAFFQVHGSFKAEFWRVWMLFR